MAQSVFLVLFSIVQSINEAFLTIFPPFPQIGLAIIGIGLLLLILYAFKSGFGQALKISIGFIVIFTILAYFLGKMFKLFGVF